jgi:HNH endonuclease
MPRTATRHADQKQIHSRRIPNANLAALHHIIAWSKGGPTTLANGVLLCGYHHRLIHRGAWTVRTGHDGHPDFIPPDWIDEQRKPIRNSKLRT